MVRGRIPRVVLYEEPNVRKCTILRGHHSSLIGGLGEIKWSNELQIAIPMDMIQNIGNIASCFVEV